MQVACRTYTSAMARMTLEQRNRVKLDAWLQGIDLDEMPAGCKAWVSALNMFCYFHWVYCINLLLTCRCCNYFKTVCNQVRSKMLLCSNVLNS